jgi:hypothetical protein
MFFLAESMIKLLANCLWRKVGGKRRERSKLGVSVQLLWFSFLLLWRWKVKNAEKDSDKQEKHYHLLQKHHQALDLFVLIKCKKYGNYYYWITIGSLFLKQFIFSFPLPNGSKNLLFNGYRMWSRVCLPRAVPPGPRSTIGVPSSRLQVTVGSGKPLQTNTNTKINWN